LDYNNGFWLGSAQDVARDQAGARESWQQSRSELERFLKEQPEVEVGEPDRAIAALEKLSSI
jgi:hypothetical protein